MYHKKHIVHRDTVSSEADAAAITWPENMPAFLQRVYLNRGVRSEQDLDLALANLPKPDSLKGLAEAIALLIAALQAKRQVCIVGDFDADGATSTALMVRVLRSLGMTVSYFVPNRFEYGYGLSVAIVDELCLRQKPDVIVTVDNGISSIEGVLAAKQQGIKVIITDHHLPGATLPAADAIVNPNQPGCDFIAKNLAGVGVAFYVLSALRAALREQGYFANHNLAEPKLADYIDLVALGTVADVVPLDYYNRILVQQGLLRIRAGAACVGIQALLQVAGKNKQQITASDIGFALGPRLNAAGRMDDMSTGIECLLADSSQAALLLAQQLDDLNRERRSVEQVMKQEAEKILQNLHLTEGELPWGLALFDEGWHQGVVGIVASRIKDRYHRPVIAFALADDVNGDNSIEAVKRGEIALKGSARSVEGVHIRDVLDAIAAKNPGLVDKFGGHAMAAGLSLPLKNLSLFQQAFDAEIRLRRQVEDLQAVLTCDGELAEQEMNLMNAQWLAQAGPWGQQFPEPLFSGEFEIVLCNILKQAHAKLVLKPTDSDTVFDGIAFFVDADLQSRLQQGSRLRIVYQLGINDFRQQQNLQLMIQYMEIL